jgi:hypothetical protein
MAITFTETAAGQPVAKVWKQWAAGYAQDLAECRKVLKTGAAGAAHGNLMDEKERIHG